jgi:uncharacterized membrane protein
LGWLFSGEVIPCLLVVVILFSFYRSARQDMFASELKRKYLNSGKPLFLKKFSSARSSIARDRCLLPFQLKGGNAMESLKQALSMAAPNQLRRDLRATNKPEILLRRAIIGISLVGIAGMAAVTLYQSGTVKHLPDLPLEGFDSDKVNASDTAYGWGMPDAPLSIISHAFNIALAAFGHAGRAHTQPWAPLLASAAAAPAAAVSAKYLFYQMPVRERGWCPYCIVDALTHIASFGFTLWEAGKAAVRLRRL